MTIVAIVQHRLSRSRHVHRAIVEASHWTSTGASKCRAVVSVVVAAAGHSALVLGRVVVLVAVFVVGVLVSLGVAICCCCCTGVVSFVVFVAGFIVGAVSFAVSGGITVLGLVGGQLDAAVGFLFALLERRCRELDIDGRSIEGVVVQLLSGRLGFVLVFHVLYFRGWKRSISKTWQTFLEKSQLTTKPYLPTTSQRVTTPNLPKRSISSSSFVPKGKRPTKSFEAFAALAASAVSASAPASAAATSVPLLSLAAASSPF